jgi:putative ABC transport system substrate-binding protein
MAKVAAFHRGLSEVGFFDGQNVEVDFRWALAHYDRLPALAAALVRRKVAVIVATGGGITSAQAAKAATATIPIVFVAGTDPIASGLVASLNKPGGNLTGVSFVISALMAKRIELLHELVPNATAIGVLVNPNFPDTGVDGRTSPGGKVMGAARRDEPRPALARPRQAHRSTRPPRAGLRLVHRRL